MNTTSRFFPTVDFSKNITVYIALARLCRFVLYLSLIFLAKEEGWGQQQFTPLPYNFPDTPLVTHQVNNLYNGQFTSSMHHQFSTMAANGYGQWVCEISNSNSQWMLLGNSSFDQNDTLSPPVPNEIVAWGIFNETSYNNNDGQTEIKVAPI